MDGTSAHAAEQPARKLQAWSLPKEGVADIALPSRWPEQVTREWAWGDATGKGVRVCILDSGVDGEHPDVGGVESAVTVELDEDEKTIVSEDTEGDIAGHGTACAGIVRKLAPECSISSVRVLGKGFTGAGRYSSPGFATRWSRSSTSST